MIDSRKSPVSPTRWAHVGHWAIGQECCASSSAAHGLGCSLSSPMRPSSRAVWALAEFVPALTLPVSHSYDPARALSRPDRRQPPCHSSGVSGKQRHYPKVMGNAVELHPWLSVALLVGSELLGRQVRCSLFPSPRRRGRHRRNTTRARAQPGYAQRRCLAFEETDASAGTLTAGDRIDRVMSRQPAYAGRQRSATSIGPEPSRRTRVPELPPDASAKARRRGISRS